MKPMIRFALMSALLLISPLAAVASENEAPAPLALDDCRVLDGTLHAERFNAAVARLEARAAGGESQALKYLSNIANNRFYCALDQLGDGIGWSVTTTSDVQVATTRQRTVPIATIQERPQLLGLLREAFQRTQRLADEDAAYRNLAARYVADYPEAFSADERVAAYGDAAGVRVLACRQDEDGKPVHADRCSRARASMASLYAVLTPAQRAAAEGRARQWAKRHSVDAAR